MSALSRRTWVWNLPQPPAALWPILSDTARFNEAAAVPKYQVVETPQSDGSVHRIAHAKVAGMAMEWEEGPYQWVYQRRFRHDCKVLKGPFSALNVALDLEPDGAGTRATYTFEAVPKGLVGHLLARVGFVNRFGALIERMTRAAADYAGGSAEQPFPYMPPELPKGAAERAAAMVAEIEKTPYGHGLARRLADYLMKAQEVDLMRLRPRRLAALWGVPPRHVIELCLEASRSGLLKLMWSLLCPRCRGAKSIVAALDQLPVGVHCPSCNIDFGANFSRNVEINFQPTPVVRAVALGEYCMSGPRTTPHVVVQQTLGPGETRVVSLAIPAGAYRYRTIDPGAVVDLDLDGTLFPALHADATGALRGGTGEAGTLTLVNADTRPRTMLIESRAWVADALTAHQVTSMQAFRDLFSAEVLRADENLAIDNVTVLFTDIEGSTALYERLGDSPAYKLVREHFAVLGEVVREHDGALVKTIGDAVMAAFADPAQAVRAALAMQRRVARFNRENGAEELIIRMGLHGGACLAVTSNDRFDYFGHTVNLAARMQGQSGGGDVVISEALAGDPEVARLIAGKPTIREAAPLKGFDTPIPYRRLRHADILAEA